VYLHSGLREAGLRSQALPGADAGVVALLELLFQLLQLVRTERGPVPAELGLVRAVQTARLVLAIDICNRRRALIGRMVS
jgi:hypothetical protein